MPPRPDTVLSKACWADGTLGRGHWQLEGAGLFTGQTHVTSNFGWIVNHLDKLRAQRGVVCHVIHVLAFGKLDRLSYPVHGSVGHACRGSVGAVRLACVRVVGALHVTTREHKTIPVRQKGGQMVEPRALVAPRSLAVRGVAGQW